MAEQFALDQLSPDLGMTIWETGPQQYADAKGREIIAHKLISGSGHDRYFGKMLLTEYGPNGQPIKQQQILFKIESPTLVGAFHNFDAAMDEAKKDIDRQRRQAALGVTVPPGFDPKKQQ